LGGGAGILVIVAMFLVRDLLMSEDTGWNIFLGLMIVGILVAAFFLQKFFRENIDEIGEARFDTRNPDEKM
jgi:Na+/melibiose symporter-like transporter